MVAIPYSRQTIRDPGLGVAESASLTPVIIGTASSGSFDDFALYSEPGKLVDAHGYSDGVEAALQILELAGGPVGFIRINTSVAASSSAVTQDSAPAQTITITGDTPAFDSFVRIEIVGSGDLGVGKFRFCLDGYSMVTPTQSAPGALISPFQQVASTRFQALVLRSLSRPALIVAPERPIYFHQLSRWLQCHGPWHGSGRSFRGSPRLALLGGSHELRMWRCNGPCGSCDGSPDRPCSRGSQ